MITSPQNTRIQHIRRLQSSSRARKQNRQFVVEGIRLAEEGLQAGLRPNFGLYAAGLSPRGRQIISRLKEQGVPIKQAVPHVFRAACDTQNSQGLLLVYPISQLPLPEQTDFLLILDNLRDPGNMGTILRSALAAGAQGILLPPGNTDPYAPKVMRSAMGAHFRLPIQNIEWSQIPPLLKKMHVFIAEARSGASCYQSDFRVPLALLIGGEASGPGAEARALPHQDVHIPMPGASESLNAAIAAAVLMFEVNRQRSKN